MPHFEYAISDVHGHLPQLRDMLKLIDTHAEEHGATFTLLFLGDMVDRGDQSAEVVAVIRGIKAERPDTVILKGNHEDVFADAMPFFKARDFDHPAAELALSLGAQKTLASYEKYGGKRLDDDALWMYNLPLCRELNGRAFVHAGLMPHFELRLQPAEAMLWIRKRFFDAKKRDFPGVNYVVHGHTPTKYMKKTKDNEIEVFDWRCNIDTGVFFTGTLGCAVFDVDQPGPPIDLLYVHGDPQGRRHQKSEGGVFIPS